MSYVPPQAVELITGFEGFRPRPYLCPARRWTIGYGSTFDLSGKPITAGTPEITRADALKLVSKSLEPVADFVQSHVEVPFSEPQFAALLSLAYNIGLGNFEGSTLLEKLNAGDYAGAGDEFLRWNRGGGVVLAGLVARRTAERKLFLSVIPASDDVDPPIPAAA